jgi:hypothetical protein
MSDFLSQLWMKAQACTQAECDHAIDFLRRVLLGQDSETGLRLAFTILHTLRLARFGFPPPP